MLNRRILRIKAFKVLYSSVFSDNMQLTRAEAELDMSCEATRDLYVFMTGIVSPLTQIAREKLDALKNKFNPTEDDLNPNTKFAENRLASVLDNDVDFQKVFQKKKYSWSQYDVLLKRIYASMITKDYYASYMASEERTLAEDCRLFIRIFEEEFVDNPDIEQLLEEKSIYWNDDLAYSLTWCCKSFKTIAKGGNWEMPPLYQSELMSGNDVQSDKAFVRKLLRSSFTGYERYSSMIAESVSGWEKERLFSTDVVLVVMGLAEAASFPEIPLKVTINEYVELSKFYGTPKSRSFVNGLLDRLVQKLQSEGEIRKEGKGLL
ncbi:MAG: transcription antitermination protein NusB [Bacteroidales bacterium]|nr:transcription antitermination protein NusB [Bacteroidales bacterium]